MRLVLLLATLCGCNQVFDLQRTAVVPIVDAQYFDAPPDAPYSCPDTAAPAFSPYLHQVVFQPECRQYSEALDGFAVAQCGNTPAQMVNGRLTSIPQFNSAYLSPRLVPEGDQMLFTHIAAVDVWNRVGDGTWTQAYALTLPFLLSSAATIGTPSAATPMRHIMLTNGDSLAHELVFDSTGNATEVHAYTPQDLGPGTTMDRAPNLTADGLHAVFISGIDSGGVFYASRPSIDAQFAADSPPITAVGYITDPFLTHDCAHLYFTAVGSVVYVSQ